ncbi:16377_t:CDS:1, partial [Gigaspora margarita]
IAVNDLRSRAKARIFKTGLDNEASIDFPFYHGNSLDRDDRS